MPSDRAEQERSPFRILLLEGSITEAYLVDTLLKYTLRNYELTHVTSGKDFALGVQRVKPHLIISEYSLPAYDGQAAIVAARALYPGTPFIFFSRTIEEGRAIASFRLAASDYIHKDNPELLIAAVERALIDAEERETQSVPEQHLQRSGEYLHMEIGPVIFRDSRGAIKFWNSGAEGMFGLNRKRAIGAKANELMILTTLDAFAEAIRMVQEVGQWKGELGYRLKTGEAVSIMSRWTLEKPNTGLLSKALIVETEITVKKLRQEKVSLLAFEPTSAF